MSGSGAGLNRVFATILTCQPGASIVATPLANYGAIGINDSGMALNEAMNFTKWTFSIPAGTTGYTISLYGTNDPKAYAAWRQAFNPGQYPGGVLTLPASSWQLLPGPQEQTGTGSIANPMTSTTNFFQFSGSLLAVRAVLTAVTTPTGVATVNVEAVP